MLSREAKWAVFVKRACHRFRIWWTAFAKHREVMRSNDEIQADEIPPLDVLMVFHSCKYFSSISRRSCR